MTNEKKAIVLLKKIDGTIGKGDNDEGIRSASGKALCG
jgi:hypothetical protein